jgi:hypothetical protein
VLNNPLRYVDPDGHSALGAFFTGFAMELGRTVVWFHPQAQRDLSVNASESDAQIVGRVAADVVSMVVGVAAIDAGIGLGGGGVVACGTGVGCLAGAGAVAAAVPIIAEGAGVATNGAIGLGENLAMLRNDASTSTDPYPKVIDPRTGKPISEPPEGLEIAPQNQRVPWGGQERAAFIRDWYDRGYTTPSGGWERYDLHHIIPREYGGSNDFWNIVPVERGVHQQQLNPWWNRYGPTPR